MPLYNNILLSKKNETKGNEQNNNSSNLGMKLLQDHLASKRRSKLQSSQKVQKQTDRSQITSENTLHKESDSHDEYDPMLPNSYEVLLAEQRLASKKTVSTKIDTNILNVLDRLDDDDYSTDKSGGRGTAIAPPPSLQQSEKFESSNVAAKIMSKMGYKAGQGLGKDEQGISSPLEVEKSGINSGRIVQPTKLPKSDDTLELLRESTRVLLLQNMVGPGEVDDDLEGETKEECKKYGDVIKCLIYEIPNKKVPDDEAVRIFVEFRQVESAIKAVRDLNGRYFGGRVVKASFYSVDRFNRYELGPSLSDQVQTKV